ncbi:hypothetical protein J500_2734 [Acinetobacter sp. 479375]|nr:hypothetical protein J500_2734 [Acinetobacter sp. 479375]
MLHFIQSYFETGILHFDEIVTISILNVMNLCLTVSAINQSHLL